MKMPKLFPHGGVVVPMVTPFTSDGELDDVAVRRIIDRLAACQLGIFILGTTGEAASTSPALRRRFVQLAVEHAAGRVLVYAGIGDNCVATSIAAGYEYLHLGVDAVVALLPSYYVLEPPEMQAYFEYLAANVPGPLIIYNIPQTTRMTIPVEVVESLARIPNIIGLKDSDGTPGRIESVARRLADRPDFTLYLGVAAQAAAALRLGFTGIVPSSGNLVQEWWRDLMDHARAGRWGEVETLQERLNAAAAVFQTGRTLGQSLAALKLAMHLRGYCNPDVLPPLLPVSGAGCESIRALLEQLKLP